MKLFNQDMKHYKAQDGAMLAKTSIWMILAMILALICYTSNQQYEECLAGSQSVVLCGGGNN
jgi:hypothetical protein